MLLLILGCDIFLKLVKLYNRLACLESVQYFQFDSDRNLFVYEPGAGFSGNCVRVEPGFDLNEISQMYSSAKSSLACDGVLQVQKSESTSQHMSLSTDIVAPTTDKK